MEKNKQLRAKIKDLDGADYKRVPKLVDALEKKERHKCILFLAEGDSAKAAIQGGRGLNSRYIASFPLKGKPLNVRDKELSVVLGIKEKKIDKKTGKEKKSEPSVIQNILTLVGLTIGKPVETTALPEAEWVELEINGEKIIANINDEIHIDGKWIKVAEL